MNFRAPSPRGRHRAPSIWIGPRGRGLRLPGFAVAGVLAALFLAGAGAGSIAHAGPYVWDQDEDGLDDRMETVQLLGYRFAFEYGDTLQRERIDAENTASGVLFSVYVVYDHPPTASDLAALTLLGVPVHDVLTAVPAVRSTMTFAQASLANSLPDVERIEAIPMLYPVLHDANAALGVSDPSQVVFPAWETAGLVGPGTGGPLVGGVPTKRGVGKVIAILDTGINDAPDGGYPGHESLLARVLGGADFTHGDSLLDTPNSGSVNPSDHGGPTTHAHATHVAGIAAGTGGATGYARGIAPDAKLVDVRVLGDLGRGSAVAEAIDWCIANKDRDWGDPSFQGIDVINLSLSSTDLSDGNDVASRAAARAVEQGIVVVASMGNDGLAGHVPSPAAGDGVIAVGAWDIQRSGRPDDDQPATFNNWGPRAGDGDADAYDEQKPTLLAPGVAILAPDGDPGSDGEQYRRASGTSSATAMVSGAAALLLSLEPGLTPAQVTARLTDTARRELPGLAPGAAGADPRWDSVRGYGLLDVYAAGLEAASPSHTQVRRFALTASAEAIAAEVWTQRELGASHLVIERAADLGGGPGTFAPYDSFTCTGDGSLADLTNRTVYARTWNVPPAEQGATFWYRTAYTEGGVHYTGPARPVRSGLGPSAATLEATIVHNAYDHDIDAAFEAASGYVAPPGTLSLPLPASSSAVSSSWVSGVSANGNIELTFRMEVPVGAAEGFLPPSDSSPWTLRVNEAGYLNRSGRVESFKLTWHAPGGDQVFEGSPAPAATYEGGTTRVRIPAPVTGVPGDPGPPAVTALTLSPNPARAGAVIAFSATRAFASAVQVYDLKGRRVGVAPLVQTSSERAEARWTAQDIHGAALAPGVYFARAGRAPSRRLVLIGR